MAILSQTIPRLRELPRNVPQELRGFAAEIQRLVEAQGRLLQEVIQAVNTDQIREGTTGGTGQEPTVQSRGTLARDLLLMGG
jgi:hypothetical protein